MCQLCAVNFTLLEFLNLHSQIARINSNSALTLGLRQSSYSLGFSAAVRRTPGPESPDRDTQAIDVRDLAAWIVTGAEERLTGVYDATGRVQRLGDLVDEVNKAVGGAATLVWAPADFLLEREVTYWSGPRSLPLWLPAEARGMTSHDVSAAFDAGLTTRPVGETAVATLAWLRDNPVAPRTGLSRAEEQDLLDDWYTVSR